jgi:hypothetical protein
MHVTMEKMSCYFAQQQTKAKKNTFIATGPFDSTINTDTASSTL